VCAESTHALRLSSVRAITYPVRAAATRGTRVPCRRQRKHASSGQKHAAGLRQMKKKENVLFLRSQRCLLPLLALSPRIPRVAAPRSRAGVRHRGRRRKGRAPRPRASSPLLFDSLREIFGSSAFELVEQPAELAIVGVLLVGLGAALADAAQGAAEEGQAVRGRPVRPALVADVLPLELHLRARCCQSKAIVSSESGVVVRGHKKRENATSSFLFSSFPSTFA